MPVISLIPLLINAWTCASTDIVLLGQAWICKIAAVFHLGDFAHPLEPQQAPAEPPATCNLQQLLTTLGVSSL